MYKKKYANNNTQLFQRDSEKTKVPELQRKFLEESSYNILSRGGKTLRRSFELLAFNDLAGKILIKEKVYFKYPIL